MSHDKDKNHKRSVADESAIEAIVRRVLAATGRIVPQTEQEVADAEARIREDTVQVPNGLIKPPTGPPSDDDARIDPCRGHPQTRACENLARAARCGEEISPEVQARMEEDRLNAEREANDGE
jgi:hypothetical protein